MTYIRKKIIDDLYEVDNLGNIYVLEKVFTNKYGKQVTYKERIQKGHKDKNGYIRFTAFDASGRKMNLSFHRMVAIAFIPNPENKPEVNHINGVKSDNRVENLEWTTGKENVIHAHKTGLVAHSKGQNHYSTNLTDEDVLKIRSKGKYDKLKVMAEDYGLSVSCIARILNRKRWKHI